MKIIYYVTDLGLGHASRTVAIVRSLLEKNTEVIIRNNDPISFFKKSLPQVRIMPGQTDFGPIMDKKNSMKIDMIKTKHKISKWIEIMSNIVDTELSFVKKEKPDVIISDISIMPILVAKKNHTKSVAISNFVWNESVTMDKKSLLFFKSAYADANMIIKLPFGTPMEFQNTKEFGLVSRKPTEKDLIIRKKLGISHDEKLITLSLSGIKEKEIFKKSKNIKILDVSDYDSMMKLKEKVNFAEGENIINASDMVICKCGYGFVSECLSTGTRFRYLLEPAHKEAHAIHDDLIRKGIKNRILLKEMKDLKLDDDFITQTPIFKMKTSNDKVTNAILNI